MVKLVVTRHIGALNWLVRHGHVPADVDVVVHATADNVRGRDVYGVLPLHLAVEAGRVNSVDLPGLPADRRGTELSADEMDDFGAVLRTYVVMTGEAFDGLAGEVNFKIK